MERRLKALLKLALQYEASDIHFTRRHEEVKIEMRINNKMRKVKTEFEDYKLFHYLQYLAGLDLASRNKPQTGQFELEVNGELLSLRYACISSLYFHNSVLRILNQKKKIEAKSLSLLPWQNDLLQKIIQKKSGLILFSGPTSSGKTTTMYTLLKNIQNKKIYTIEDPIEVYSDQYVQLQVNDASSFGYKEGIKQILRHDPDIIMIGEIRDEQAAMMAIRAANTGHLVLSSIHASSSHLSINRMLELGCNKEQLQDVLIFISNQKMFFDQKGRRMIIYEMMDEEELDYYFKYHRHSERFISIQSQLKHYVHAGILNEEDLL